MAAAKEEAPSTVILDLLMPGVDGFEFLKRFRSTAAGRSTPVIIWTVKDVSGKEAALLQASVQAIVSKSQGADALIEELRRCVPQSASTVPGEGGRGR